MGGVCAALAKCVAQDSREALLVIRSTFFRVFVSNFFSKRIRIPKPPDVVL